MLFAKHIKKKQLIKQEGHRFLTEDAMQTARNKNETMHLIYFAMRY